MNFREQLLAEPSKANTDFMVHVINGDKNRFEELFQFIYDSNGCVANRAAWVVEKCAAEFPWLVETHLKEIIDQLLITPYDGSRRLLLKILTLFPVPAEREAELVDLCFTWLESPNEKVGLKVYAMQILSDFCKQEPDIIPEFLSVLENHYERNSIAFQSRADKIFKQY